MSPLLSLTGIDKYYTQKLEQLHILKNINLSVNPGEFIAIVGESGSGKSTLLNCIGLLDLPSNGAYQFNQETVAFNQDQNQHIRAQIGFIFQQAHLLQSYTALENVALPLIYRGISQQIREAEAEKLLNEVGLGHRLYHHPNQLSGGEMQRVAIARALITHPKLLLADEPTGSLDEKNTAEIMDLLKKIHLKNTSIILITHSDFVAKKSQRIYQLKDGALA